jgi:hypothetical protein
MVPKHSAARRGIPASLRPCDIGPLVDEKRYDVDVIFFGRYDERRHLEVILGVVDFSARLNKLPNDFETASIGGRVESGKTTVVASADISAPLDENGDHFWTARKGGHDQRRFPSLVSRFERVPLVEQFRHGLRIALAGGIVNRGP